MVGKAGIARISPDGAKVEMLSKGSRNPLGLGVRADGLALADSSEGSPSNGTCTIYEGTHPENEKSISLHKRILYLPRGLDNSPGSRIFLDDPEYGPLGQGIIGTSFGNGSIYQILRNTNEGTPQAAMVPLPFEVGSGAARIAVNPADKQVYVVGFDGWGDLAVEEGSFARLRHTPGPSLRPVGWKAYRNGISVSFSSPLDPASVESAKFFMQQWNYLDAEDTYGSPEYSVKNPEQIGHDYLPIASVHLSADGKELFLESQGMLPATCTQIYGKIRSADGVELKLDLYATLNQLNGNHPSAPAYSGDKTFDLVVPQKKNNGSTYRNLMDFFDKKAGRDLVVRGVVEAVAYEDSELSFDWLKVSLIDKQCIMCHAAGTAIDYSTYKGFMAKVNTAIPDKSFVLGMMRSESMPPYPLPTVAPEMQEAVAKWIRNGAVESAGDVTTKP